MIAPLLGGLLSKPAELLPSVFKGTIFETYPFALPSVVTACVPFLSAIAGIFLARETLPRDKRKAIRHLFARTKHTVQTKRPPTNLFTRATIYILFVFVQMIVSLSAQFVLSGQYPDNAKSVSIRTVPHLRLQFYPSPLLLFSAGIGRSGSDAARNVLFLHASTSASCSLRSSRIPHPRPQIWP